MSGKTKIWLVIAVVLVLVGGILFGGALLTLGWNITNFSTENYETNEYEIQEEYKDISITTDTADIVFAPSEDEKTVVVCCEQENIEHTVVVEDGILIIKSVDTRKWYEHIGIIFRTSKITVYVPQKEYDTISVETSTGDVCISDVICGEVKIDVSTGEVELTDIECQNLMSSGDTGDILLEHVLATGMFSIERDTGDIKFDSSDAAEIFVETDTGDVTGTLLSEKIFYTETDTGRIEIPQTKSGGKCEISTDTGDIKLNIK